MKSIKKDNDILCDKLLKIKLGPLNFGRLKHMQRQQLAARTQGLSSLLSLHKSSAGSFPTRLSLDTVSSTRGLRSMRGEGMAKG
mmetsp:Transcript_19290/g.32874  ORF Transcript_19290/g.32874 Transcript_19290/m.32874 type:complete len:84 (-) Transcript_19290:847-1098(-)